MEKFLYTLLLLLLGKGLSRIAAFPKDTAQALNLFVIYVSLPALILLRIPELDFGADILTPVFMPWAMLLLSAALVVVFGKVLSLDRLTTGALLLLVPLGNTSFLGIPMVTAFFGTEAVRYAVLYDQLGSFLALATYGSIIVALYGGTEKPTAAGIVKRVFTFPPFLALLVAFAIRDAEQPQLVRTSLAQLAGTLVPLTMVAVGFQLKLRLSMNNLRPLGAGLLIKLVLAPLAALACSMLLGLEGEAVRVAIFEAGMPPMVTAGAVAIMAGLAPELAAALVGFGIIGAFVTLPLLFKLL